MRTSAIMTLIIAAGFLTPFGGFSQHDLGLYYLSNVPQRIQQNPAFIPKTHGYFGFPGLSGIQGTTATPFTYNDAFTIEADDSLTLRVENMIGKLTGKKQFKTSANAELISFGWKAGKKGYFINFSLRERFSESFHMPQDLANLLWYGNHHSSVLGREIQIAPTINIVAYDEYALSFSGFAIKNKLTYGVRVKFLAGRFNMQTVKSEFDFYTDPESFDLMMKSNVELRTSGIDDIEDYLDQPIHSLVFPGNRGFAVDLGATYQINEHFSANASLLDLGSIKWKEDNLTYVSEQPGKPFSFDGLRLSDFVDLFENPDAFGQRLEDSLRSLIRIDSVYDVPYSAGLPFRFNIGGTYTLSPKHSFNLLFSGISWAGYFNPALSLSYNYRIHDIFELLVSYNIFNNQYTNLGGGINITAGPVQFYFVTDNIPGMVFYRSTNNYSMQFGINFLLGRNRGQVAAVPLTPETGTQPVSE